MEKFNEIYYKIKQNSNSEKIKSGKILIDVGMQIAQMAPDINIKIYIYNKLIEIFPEEPAFYYYMGFTIKEKDPTVALEYFQKSYDIEPNNRENCIDLCNILYQSGQAMRILEMNKTGKLEQFLKDERFLTIYTQAKCEQFYYKDCLDYLLYLIKSRSKIKATTYHEKEWKYSNYLNAGHIYSIYSNQEKAILYTEKAFEIALKFDLKLSQKLSGIQNLLSFMDYGYVDNTVAYTKALRINEILPNQSKYSHERSKNSKIRIGYVSSDLNRHAAANFILPIVNNHSSSKFDVYVYANQPNDLYNIKTKTVSVYNIYKLDHKSAADLIYKHKIDILIDLNGHTANNRIAIFSFNPAPIQITYIGYPNTTGLKAVKYKITDNIADNIETSQKYSEELIRLSGCFLLYESINQHVPFIPRKTGDSIILGALNKEKKNTKYVLDTWRIILEKCPNVKLLIKLDGYDDKEARTEFYIKQLNVSKNRLIIFEKMNDFEYNKLYQMIDILLDTYPYSGTTTTCNALYNSIPVVTMYNKNYHAHNVSSSILLNAKIEGLIAQTPDEYIEIATNLIESPDKIDVYKSNIGNKFEKSMNSYRFMKEYEIRLEEVYRRNTQDEIIQISM